MQVLGDTPMATIEIKGLDKLQRKLGAVQARSIWRGILTAGAGEVKNYISVYPPASLANSPNARQWYERGYGPRWRAADGSLMGRKTSETLGRRWTTQVEDTRAVIGNNASYARFVQSDAKQAWYHRARNWRTDKMAVAEIGPKVIKMAAQAVHEALSR